MRQNNSQMTMYEDKDWFTMFGDFNGIILEDISAKSGMEMFENKCCQILIRSR